MLLQAVPAAAVALAAGGHPVDDVDVAGQYADEPGFYTRRGGGYGRGVLVRVARVRRRCSAVQFDDNGGGRGK